MKKMLLVLALATVFSMLTLAAAVTLEYWNGFTGPDGRFMQGMVDRFNAEHEGEIQVNMSTMLWGDYWTKLPIALASGKGPDVGVIPVDNLKNIAGQGMLIPLDAYLGKMGLGAGDIVPSLWNAAQVDGEQYAIPLDTHPLTFYWNKELFRQAGLDPENPPRTRQEFLDAAKKLTKDLDGDGKIDQWGTMIPVGWPNFFIWYSIFFSNEGVLFNEENTQALFGSSEGLDAMQFLVDLVYTYKVSPENVQVDADVDAFKRGQVAMEFNGIWMLTGYLDVEGLDFGAGPVPQLGSEKPAQWGGSHTMSIFKQRKPDQAKLDAAATFIGWISNHSSDWGKAGQVPANLSVQQSAEFLSLPHMETIAKGASTVTFPPFFPLYNDATGPIWEALNLAILNQKTVEQAMQDAVSISNEILAE
ncbi:MAG TPA: ABC transporter substrate-binding protein [Thermotogota bacterium]|nr:ABC transporter substrate-binding protein [Thermotogota bacterium]HRW91512.1 ABC transporter substrate-binding protein [Thermotogota bacterium]